MRIVNLYARFKTLSGGPVFLLHLAREVTRKGHTFEILTRAVSDRCRPAVPEGVRVRVPRGMGWTTGWQLVDSFLDLLFAALLGFCVPRDIDVLVIHSDAALPALFTYRVLRRGRARCVYYCYQPTQFAYNLTWEKARAYAPLGYLIPLVAPLYRWFDAVSARQADAIIAFSTAYQDRCRRLYRTEKVFLAAPGVDVSNVARADGESVRARLGLGEGEAMVLTVNKLIVQKNVDLLVRAARLLRDQGVRVRTVVVGDGPEKPRLERLSRDLGVERDVVFTGFLRDWGEVCDHYAACDVYVFLEKDVPFGMTVLEAGAFGKPSVAVGSGGALDTVRDGVSGLLVSDRLDEAQVASCIAALVSDASRRRQMGGEARRMSARFTWERCADDFLLALDPAASPQRGPEKP